MFRTILRRAYNTFRSKNDEQNNQELLQMIKRIPALGERRVKTKVEREPNENDLLRGATFDKLNKILNLFYTDPLTWDTSTLSRIFKLPEDYCKCLVESVQPLIYFTSNKVDEPVKLVKVAFVVDLARFKSDKNYMATYQRLNFRNPDTKLDILSTESVVLIPEHERL